MDTFKELKQMEVINACDGSRLGFVCDLEFDIKCGKITAIIVPEPTKGFCIFGKDKDFRIPWECIVKIGDDVILVNVDPKKLIS